MNPSTSPAPAAPPDRHIQPVHAQLAALCWRKANGGREVLLVTSSTGRWILPKGWPINGLHPGDAALVEAWEEAGVKKGKVTRKPLGAFLGAKRSLAGDDEPSVTKVFAVKVEQTVTDYPEADRRDRIWVSPAQAAELVDEDGLREILRAF